MGWSSTRCRSGSRAGSRKPRSRPARWSPRGETIDSARGTVSGKKEADAELEKFYEEVLPPDLSGARRVLYPHLDQLARKANLTAGAYRFHPDDNRDAEICRKITMTMNLTGDYSRYPKVHPRAGDRAGVSRARERGGHDHQRGRPRLSVVAQVATYYRAPAHGN